MQKLSFTSLSLEKYEQWKNPVCPSAFGLQLREGTSVWAEHPLPADNLKNTQRSKHHKENFDGFFLRFLIFLPLQ